MAYALRTLTGAETRYAQIEKELLTIVFACERFEPCVYGRHIVHVETDHKPLEPIFVKELNAAPKRLQRMLLRLQKYSLCVAYKKGRDMYLADTLSRAFLPEVNACEFTQALESVDHLAFLPVSNKRWKQIKHVSADDPVSQKLRATIRQGWLKQRSDVPECLCLYFDIRDVLTVQDELVFKGQLLVVPANLRKELLTVLHSSHIGIEGCVCRARDTLYWPRMAVELRQYISKCDICLAHRDRQAKEPLLKSPLTSAK